MKKQSKVIIEIIIAATLGFLFGVFLELFAVFFSGGGHGWNGAGRYGIFLLIACPLVAISMVGKSIIYKFIGVLGLIIALIIDINLINSIIEEYKYFEKIFIFGVIWLILMFLWQLVAILTLFLNTDKNT